MSDATRALGSALADVVGDAIDARIDDAVIRLAERLRTLEPRAVTLEVASDLLGCSTSTVQRLVDGGHLPKLPHVGRRVLIPVAAIDEFCSTAAAAPVLAPFRPGRPTGDHVQERAVG